MKYLWQFLRERKGKLLLTLLLLLGQSVGTLLIPSLIAGIVDDGILKGDMEAILRIGGIMLIVSIIATVISIFGAYTSADLGALLGRDMRDKLTRKTQEISAEEFDRIGVSSLVTRSTSDIANLQTTLGMVLQLIVPAPFMAAVSVFLTFQQSSAIGWTLVGTMAVFLLFAFLILKYSGRLSRQIQPKVDRMNLRVREAVTGTRVIRAFGNERLEEERAGETYEDYAKTMIKLNRFFSIVNPVVWIVMGVSMALVLWLGGSLAVGGQMQVGQITAVSEYVIMTLSYLIMAASICTMLPKFRSCLDRLEEVLDIPVQAPNVPAGRKSADGSVVSFENVNFSYPGAEHAVLSDLNFSCQAGQTTAIIGGTGAGKSTIADILLRLHEVSSGAIRLLGKDVRGFTEKELRGQIGYVPQKAFLFSGTIAENLRMGNERATDEELWAALQVAQAASFVKELPKGLNASVSQGGQNFSGGQRQRLAIARALVKKASVYLFDDSFSALDARTDAALREALRSYQTDSVKIIIAQRVSTIRNAEQILVLDEGKICGAGRHGELMENCEVYKEIVKSQMKQNGDAA